MQSRRNNNKSKRVKRSNPKLQDRVPRPFGIIQPRARLTMRYVDNISSGTITTVSSSVQKFRMNSLWDPDYTGGGHQPYGRDQMAALYNFYRVVAFTWKISFVPIGNLYEVSCAPYNGNYVASNDINDLRLPAENPRGSKAVFGANSTTPQHLRGRVVLQQIYGATNQEFWGDDKFCAALNANPLVDAQLVISVYNPNLASISTYYTIELSYDVQLENPIQPTIS